MVKVKGVWFTRQDKFTELQLAYEWSGDGIIQEGQTVGQKPIHFLLTVVGEGTYVVERS